MAEESELQYKDISELRKDLDMMKKKKEMPSNELYQTVQSMAQTMSDILEIFVAAAEQMKQEEKWDNAETKKHDMILARLDKITSQNKTIAEGLVSLVEIVKGEPKEEPVFKPMAEPKPQENTFMKPQQDWQPKPERRQAPQMQAPQMASFSPQPMPNFAPPNLTPPIPPPDFGMPSLEPVPEPDLDFPEEPFPLEEEPKKKGIFGMFKK